MYVQSMESVYYLPCPGLILFTMRVGIALSVDNCSRPQHLTAFSS